VRYYNIVIRNPSTGQVVVPAALAALGVKDTTYSSFVNGQTLTAALDVEIDAFVYNYASASADVGSLVAIWGISLQEIAQSTDLNQFNIEVSGGFKPGLPLATAAANSNQSGLLFSGWIEQSVGNWIGTEMILSFYVRAGTSPSTPGYAPLNLSFNWQQGTSFSDAIRATLQTAFPASQGYTINVNVSSNLSYPGGTQPGVYPDMQSFAGYVQSLTQPIIGGSYSGVQVTQLGKTISVSDSTTIAAKGNPTTILFQDMIGQPTWINFGTIQVKCPMRTDVQVNSQIKLDPLGTLITTQPNFQSTARDKSVFQGTFNVVQVHHVGRFRSPSPDAWVTVIDAVKS
jgi:hypothetical protein